MIADLNNQSHGPMTGPELVDYMSERENEMLINLPPDAFAFVALGLRNNFSIILTEESRQGLRCWRFCHIETGCILRKPDVTTVIEAWNLAAHMWQCMEGEEA